MPFSVTLLVPGVAERISAEVPELGHPAATSSPVQDWEETGELDVLCASANPVQRSVALTIVRKCFFISCDSPCCKSYARGTAISLPIVSPLRIRRLERWGRMRWKVLPRAIVTGD